MRMRKWMVLNALIPMLGFHAWAGQDRGGGDPVGLDFEMTARAAVREYEGLSKTTSAEKAKLDNAIKLAKYVVLDQTELPVSVGDEVQKGIAVNDPKTLTIWISRSGWTNLKDFDQRKSLALHEIASLEGLESTGKYVLSSQYLLDLQTQSDEGVLLYAEAVGNDHNGMSEDEATAECSRYKKKFQDQYFFVYCVYVQKNWQEIETRTFYKPHYHFLGYSTQSDSGGGSDAVWGRNGGFSRSSSSSTYDQEPVIYIDYSPYQYTGPFDYSVFGLDVYGLGDYTNEPWHLIWSSKSFLGGRFPLEYATEDQAQQECNLRLADQLTQDPAMDRAVCFVKSDQDSYYYEIKSQNPYIGN